MRSLMRWVMRVPALHRYLRSTYIDEANRRGDATRNVETSIGELMPIACRPASSAGPRRLNLLVPALSTRHVFGGISTALQLFERLTGEHADARIVLTDEQHFTHADNPMFGPWRIASMEDDDTSGRIIVAAGNRYGRTLPVSARDDFMVTAWWTAHVGRAMRDWQRQAFALPARRPFVYLIQDFEPGFYAWSSRYALAEATYRNDDGLVPVFNTSLLHRYFVDEGYPVQDAFVLEPGLNTGLARARGRLGPVPRENRVLVYGRPGVDRNAFPIIVEALTRWSGSPAGREFSFHSVGEPHPDLPLAGGKVLESLGKMTLEGYAAEMLRARIGISLMVSPHPSYPPLEMAAFGMAVISNRFKRKDLSAECGRIASVDPLDVDSVVAALDRLAGHDAGSKSAPDVESPFFRCYLDGGTDLSALAASVNERLAALARQTS